MKFGLIGFWVVVVNLISNAELSTAEREKQMESSRVVSLRSMEKMSPAEKESLLKDFENEHQATNEILIQNLFSKQEQTQFCAAYLLGHYRYADASVTLADVITMENKDYTQLHSRLPRWNRYPAVEALIRIGKPSIPSLLRNLETSNDEHVRGLSARVIYYVEGPELAKIVVKNAIAKQADLKKKNRLMASLPLVRGGEYKKPGK